MLSNRGFILEDQMVTRLDKKRFKELENNLKHLLLELYHDIEDNELITCEKQDGFYKTDIKVTCKNKTFNVSLKTGKADVIHEERIKTFILFLRENGISTETQKTILLYQYGDGTLDGTGKTRYNYDELMFYFRDRIQKANEELNRSVDFKLKVLDHCMFTGVIDNPVIADAVYHGNLDYGIVVKRSQIENHIRRKNYDFYKNLHIGPIMLRPHARYVNKSATNEDRRHKIECYWPNLSDDIDYISRRYNN